MTANDCADLTDTLRDAVIDHFADRPEIEFKLGHSNVSCSAYLEVRFMAEDGDGDLIDIIGGCKLRFSDHADRYGSDLTIRIDEAFDIEEGNEVELADWRVGEMVNEAVAFIEKKFKDQAND